MKRLLIALSAFLLVDSRAAEPPDRPTCRCSNAASATAPFSPESIYQMPGRFTTDTGRAFTLGSLRGHPVVLDLFFASCGSACPLTVTEMQRLQQQLPLPVRARTRFVLVSFDVTRDTPAALARYRSQRRLGDNWILLHGDADSVRELAVLVGVHYRETADGAFIHSNQLTLLNPEGEIIYRRAGLQGGLDAIRAALVATAR